MKEYKPASQYDTNNCGKNMPENDRILHNKSKNVFLK